MTTLCRSPAETQRYGIKLGRQLEPKDVVALMGEIGTGKTTFVQGIARGLGIPSGTVTSPSFVLIREYHGRLPLTHADLFRLSRLPEAATVGLEEYYEAGGVTVIEWANRLPGILPLEFLEIQFEAVNSTTRKLTLVPHGERYEKRVRFHQTTRR